MHHFIRMLMGIIEATLRITVFNKDLDEVNKVIKDVPYGSEPKQRFDIIIPKGSGQFPILFYFHGGGWVTGDKSNFNWVCHKFASNGMLVFNVNYRLSPENKFPEPLKDVSSAITKALAYAKEYGGDQSRIYIAGDSAGAHLASWYMVALRDSALLQKTGVTKSLDLENIHGCLLFYGIYDLEAAWNIEHKVIKSSLKYFLGQKPEVDTMRLASPSQHVRYPLPPFFLCAGEPDVLFDQTNIFSDVLKDAGIKHKTLLFSKQENPESNHSFINFGKRNCSQIAIQEANLFISNHNGVEDKIP